jgi:hypothetical protein
MTLIESRNLFEGIPDWSTDYVHNPLAGYPSEQHAERVVRNMRALVTWNDWDFRLITKSVA